MKKRFAIVLIMLALVLQCFAIWGCNSAKTGDASTDAPESTADKTEAPTSEPTDKPTEKPTEGSTEKPTDAPVTDDGEGEGENEDENEDENDGENDGEDEMTEEELAIAELLDLRHELRADENGSFKVLILSDIQGGNGHIEIPESVLKNIETVVVREEPDLVIFNGDNCHAINNENNLRKYLSNMTGFLEENKIPWAHVYGNHDDEGGISKERQSEIYSEFDYCMSKVGNVSGVGNFVLPVLSHDGSKILYNVWCLDSHGKTKLDDQINVTLQNGVYFKGVYDYIRPDQIEWYTSSSKLLEEYNGAEIPAIMAFHIPLQETGHAWMVKDSAGLEYTGTKGENGGFSAINSGLFAAVLDRGDVRAIVNGHDHVNDFMVNYHGVKLCYSSTVSTMSYHNTAMLGARVFEFTPNAEGSLNTYMSYIDENYGK